jgi:hypothetical protein
MGGSLFKLFIPTLFKFFAPDYEENVQATDNQTSKHYHETIKDKIFHIFAFFIIP